MIKIIAWGLVILGALIIIFSKQIVFPGLEILLGIETLVGAESVYYNDNGSYVVTNPGAMMKWVSSVAVCGFLVYASRVGLLIIVKWRARTQQNAGN
ncbi:MAG: hypothetical protein JXA52_10460 [Planctomycetes bacterium]|nr:hypothetical protein [Planctomycetota bacterium]